MEADVTEAFAYDYNGRIIRKSATVKDYDGAVHYTSYAYNLAGHLRQVVYEGEAKQPFTVTYRINGLGQVVSVADREGELTAYAYNADSSLREETFRPAAGAALVRHYRYDCRGSLTELSDSHFQETLTYTQNGYDGYVSYTGRIVSASCRFSGLKEGKPAGFIPKYRYQYAYDRLGQLTTAQHDREPKWSYGVDRSIVYDANGNTRELYRSERPEEFAYQSGTNKLARTGIEAKDYRYDAAGNVIQAPARGITKITYDLRSQQAALMEVNDGQDAVTFCYDGGGRRVCKQGSNGNKLYVLNQKGLPLLEKTAGPQVETAYYIYGLTGLLAVKKQGRTYFLLKDHSGSTRAVYDGEGICAAYDYDPFGSFLGEVFEPQGRVTNYLYTGQELDSGSGLYNYKARFYDSCLGRFYSTDPAGQFASPYSYAGGDPINFNDPDGMWSWESFGSIMAGIGAMIAGTALIYFSGGALIPVLVAQGYGLATASAAATVGAMAGGALAGAGTSSVFYGAAHSDDFTWTEWGIQVGIGAVTGAITGGGSFGAEQLGIKWGLSKGADLFFDAATFAGLGALNGYLANGMLNSSTGRAFHEGADLSALIGALVGASGQLGRKIAGGWGRWETRVAVRTVTFFSNTLKNEVGIARTWEQIGAASLGALRGAVIGGSVGYATSGLINAAEGKNFNTDAAYAIYTGAFTGLFAGGVKVRRAASNFMRSTNKQMFESDFRRLRGESIQNPLYEL